DALQRDGRGVELVDVNKGRPLRECTIWWRRTELLALQRLRVFRNAERTTTDDREGRDIVDHHDRTNVLRGVLIEKLDQRVDIAEAHLVGAGGNPRDRLDRSCTGVDGHVESFGSKVPIVLSKKETRCWPLETPVERK